MSTLLPSASARPLVTRGTRRQHSTGPRRSGHTGSLAHEPGLECEGAASPVAAPGPKVTRSSTPSNRRPNGDGFSGAATKRRPAAAADRARASRDAPAADSVGDPTDLPRKKTEARCRVHHRQQCRSHGNETDKTEENGYAHRVSAGRVTFEHSLQGQPQADTTGRVRITKKKGFRNRAEGRITVPAGYLEMNQRSGGVRLRSQLGSQLRVDFHRGDVALDLPVVGGIREIVVGWRARRRRVGECA